VAIIRPSLRYDFIDEWFYGWIQIIIKMEIDVTGKSFLGAYNSLEYELDVLLGLVKCWLNIGGRSYHGNTFPSHSLAENRIIFSWLDVGWFLEQSLLGEYYRFG